MKSEKKYVVYTIMAGKYGEIRQPLSIDNRFDYVLFSNDFKESSIGVWQVRPIPLPSEIDATDNKRISRYPKTHPETLLTEYEASLYIDANLQITDQWVYDRVVELVRQGVVYAGIKLRTSNNQDCIYRHSFDMCVRRAEHDYIALQEMYALHKNGFPEHFGLNENNIIYRKHCESIQKADEEWWRWIVNFSYRDQFSYMYCLWKYNIPITYFLPVGEDSHNSKHFSITYHNADPKVAQKKWVKVGLLEWSRNYCRTLTKWHYRYYNEQWAKFAKAENPIFWLNLIGILSFIVNILPSIPILIIKRIKKCNKR